MSAPEIPVHVQEAVVDLLVGRVVGDATGETLGDLCVGEPPSAKFYLGVLAPRDLRIAAHAVRRGREAPNSAGYEFEVEGASAEIEVKATASVYYKVFPDYQVQMDRQASRDDPADQAGREYQLETVFRRKEASTGWLPVHVAADRPLANFGIEAFQAGFDAIVAAAVADPAIERREGDDRSERFVPGTALSDPGLFDAWVTALHGTPVVPAWNAAVTVMTRRTGDGRTRVSLTLVNLSEDPTVAAPRRGRQGDTRRHDDARDHFLFRVRLEVRAAPGTLVPIELGLGPDAYRYDGALPAYAANCGVKAVYDADRLVRLTSVPAPEHRTYRAPSTDHEAAAFDRLGLDGDPLSALDELLESMKAYADDPAWDVGALPPDLAARKSEDRHAYMLEVARFEDGVSWLRKDPRLLLAFRLANETMVELGRLSGKGHRGWRLFQLVFIVSQLSALAWREHDPSEFERGLWGDPESGDPTLTATVLWFPTAGGKTEAYLGLTACALFYDRARGKSEGITAWCRFPLRLLALQQTQRQLEMVVAADIVRQRRHALLEAAGGGPGERFRIAFYAGEGNTPNSLTRDADFATTLAADADRRQRYRMTDVCPYCGEPKVEIEPPDPVELRLVHRCTNCNEELPVIVVDNEVYRYLPSVVVGTLDKLANMGLSDKFGAILGDVDCVCDLHGYGRGDKCHERRAKGHPKGTVHPLPRPLYDASPTLEIVDELHMVREDLGAFGGHYETMLADLQSRLSARSRPDGRGVRMKVVATTATIRGEDRQCEHLFGLRSVVVPLPGPSLEGSFYWRVDRDAPLRRYVGIMPARATPELAFVRILESTHRALRELERDGPPVDSPLADLGPDELAAVVDYYRVSLSYMNSLVEFRRLGRSIHTQVNETLRRDGHSELDVRTLSSETSFDEVRRTLDDLEGAGRPDAVIATSMISHGVDIARLNVMLVNSVPKSMAEYIQASSRVGRLLLGVVFMIFNPLRERDRSHFRYHEKFHEYLDRMVEPVAINRWSRHAVVRTMPGLFMSDVLQAVNREYWDAGRAPGHLHDLDRMREALRSPESGGIAAAQPENLLEDLRRGYLADRPEAVELRADVTERVGRAVDGIRSAAAAAAAAVGARHQYRATGDFLHLEHPPMKSLRDVAEPIPFYTLPERNRQ